MATLNTSHFFSIFPVLFMLFHLVSPLPLHTSSRWIVDEHNHRVKLACANWVSHLEPMVAEGLSHQPLNAIVHKIAAMGFNCVRLTWPTFLVTDNSLSKLTVRQSFQNLGLVEAIAGLQAHNPEFLDFSLIYAYEKVLCTLQKYNVMVVLDNHISKPEWCCSGSDGNGFFGDQFFNTDIWIKGLTKMATISKSHPNVIGMSLRNELRGRKQNVNDWFRYIRKGAEAVHSANPDVLVIVSGLNYDRDLTFLQNRTVNLNFPGKLVFEVHWYGFGSSWARSNANQMCASVSKDLTRRALYLLNQKQGWPLFMSEFGMDLRGNVNENRYMNCLMSVAADLDLDFALWQLGGSYALRQGVKEMEEFYGVLDKNWSAYRNPNFLHRLSSIQSPFKGPGLSKGRGRPCKVLYHPSTGQCVSSQSKPAKLQLGSCKRSQRWNYSARKVFRVAGKKLCIQADGSDKPVKLGTNCGDSNSRWTPISDTGMHLSSNVSTSVPVCLDVGVANTLITSSCKCLSGDHGCDPGNQWFKIIDSTIMCKQANVSSTWCRLDFEYPG